MLCERCGVVVDRQYYTTCRACGAEADWMREAERFANALKIRPIDYSGPVFDPTEQTGREGYSASLDDALEEAAELEPEDQPFFYMTCTIEKPSLDAERVIEGLADDTYEGAEFTHEDELQAVLDAWCAKQTVETWSQCSGTVVVVDWARADAYVKAYQDKYEEKIRKEQGL